MNERIWYVLYVSDAATGDFYLLDVVSELETALVMAHAVTKETGNPVSVTGLKEYAMTEEEQERADVTIAAEESVTPEWDGSMGYDESRGSPEYYCNE